MPNIFKVLRRKTLENDSTRKYLAYAAGEILLVVAGILIALQINIWNENRKDRTLEAEYLHNMQSDLNENIESYQSYIDRTTAQVRSLNGYLDALKPGNEVPDSTVLQISGRLMAIPNMVPRTTTFDDLVATGNINLIQADSLRQAIFHYYHQVDDLMDAQDTNVRLSRENRMVLGRNPNLDMNSLASYTARQLDAINIVELSSFDPHPAGAPESDPDRNLAANIFSLESLLLQYNISYYRNGLAQARQLRDQVRAYLANR